LRRENEKLKAERDELRAGFLAAMEALEKAQKGLDLAHSCGLPPYDISGSQMWSNSAAIRQLTREALTQHRELLERVRKS
jgi:hypothetical protein